jgi:hypothetical protein
MQWKANHASTQSQRISAARQTVFRTHKRGEDLFGKELMLELAREFNQAAEKCDNAASGCRGNAAQATSKRQQRRAA